MIGYLIVYFILFMVFVVLPVGIVTAILYARYNRRERKIRGEAEAHRRILESTYDRIWFNVKRHGGLSEQHRRDFNDIYPDLLNETLDSEAFVDWLLKCNIDFDPDEFVPLVESIEHDRDKFIGHQRRIESLMKEHRLLLTSRPSKWLIRDRSIIDYVPIETDYSRWGKRL